MHLKTWLLILCLGWGLSANARPVSYPGGWTLMLYHDAAQSSGLLHYSPTASTSIGYRYEHRMDNHLNMHGLQVNHLVQRWNQPTSQANLYLISSLGYAKGVRSYSHPYGFLGLQSDWENRRWYLAYKNRYVYFPEKRDLFEHAIRVGWAPYIGDYNDLHTWLMIQVDKDGLSSSSVRITPLVRLFYNAHLLEIGVNLQGDVLLQYIWRI